VNAHPEVGVPPNAVLSTLNVVYREIELALIVTVPWLTFAGSTNACPKPTSASGRASACGR
jgi:hypothetical protein